MMMIIMMIMIMIIMIMIIGKPNLLKVYMTQKKFSLFRSLMRVQKDFENKTCLKFLKTTFIGEKYPLFPLKNVAVLGPNLPHNDVTLLVIVPGSVVFWLQNASKYSRSAASFAYI